VKRRALGIALTVAFATLGTIATARADQLVMFSQDGCPYCAAWDRNVGRIYAKTDEAKVLPLRRIDIGAPRPRDLQAIRGVVFTPTFVVLHCGREIARITGYISDDQFWGLLDAAVKSLVDIPSKGSTACAN
jgi:thioredoxin-related protein